MLCRHVGAKTHRRQHFQPFNIAFGVLFQAVEYHPATAETGHTVGFRQAVKGNSQQVRGQRGNGVVLRRVIEDLVVNFVGKMIRLCWRAISTISINSSFE